MTGFAERKTGRRDAGVPANGRRLGVLALGTLLGGIPALAVAAERGPRAHAWAGTLSPATTTTATSSLALGPPAQTFTVTTIDDVVDPGDGKLSLREAVAKANATPALDAIVFKPSLEGQTLVLTGGELVVSEDVTIDGDRDDNGSRVTIDGNHNDRILEITGGGTDVGLEDLVLTGGQSSYYSGGAVLVDGGSFTLTRCTVSDNASGYYDGGGAIFAHSDSRLTILGSTIVGNEAYYGGGIGGNATVTIRDSVISGNTAHKIGGGLSLGGSLVIENSVVSGNMAETADYARGGGIAFYGTATVARTTISGNEARYDGSGLLLDGGHITISDSTIANNTSGIPGQGYGQGAGIYVSRATLTLRNSVITGNRFVQGRAVGGGGIGSGLLTALDIANSLVAGNGIVIGDGLPAPDSDIFGAITISDGHNVFGSTVAGSVPGDRENVAPASIFAAIDAATGGGQLSPAGTVPLTKSLTNPAVSAADPITASATGQLGGPRPLPTGSLPDIGSAETDQRLSTSPTANNDVLTGSAAANNLSGLAGNDLIKGVGGNDTLNGGPGSDLLDGGPGNNKLNGSTGVDLASFAFSPVAVVVDLAATPATAKRGGETDTLTSIEGAIGTIKADTFKGDGGPNWFQGGLGKDRYTGGGGRDLYDFNAVAESPAGAGRDVVTDFVPGQDVLDLAGIDADSTLPGDQSFRWVGKAVLTGAAQLGYYVSGGNTIVRASTDADGAAELEIQLTGKKTLTVGDIRG